MEIMKIYKKLTPIIITCIFFSCNKKNETESVENILEQDTTSNNKDDNLYKIFYPSGELRYLQSYNEWGDLVGDWINYYKNGNIKQKGFYLNGQPHGMWKYYDESGNLTKEEFIKSDTNCVKFVALWSSSEIAEQLGKSKKWVFLNYTVDVLKNESHTVNNKNISKLRASSYAEIIDFTDNDFKVKSPIDNKIGWINKSHVKSVVDKNRKTKELCGNVLLLNQ